MFKAFQVLGLSAWCLFHCCRGFQVNSRVDTAWHQAASRKARQFHKRGHHVVADTTTDLLESPTNLAHQALPFLRFGSKPKELDWSCVDAVYLITCPNADPGSERLNDAKNILAEVNLLDRVQIKEFDTDDEDRIRGCYTSHISVIRDALRDMGEVSLEANPLEQIFKAFKDEDKMASLPLSEKDARVLVLEDNFALNGGLDQSLIDSVAEYAESGTPWDMIHLSYTPYVPNLVVTRTDNDRVVKLSCGLGSALGTSAYIINTAAMKAVLKEDAEQGYYAPIPDVMAKIFPETRYSAFPTPFLRASATKSLVNPQLDDLRSLLFKPAVAAQVQNILAITGLSTNVLLPLTIVLLLIGTVLSAKSSLWAGWSLLTTGSYDGPLILPVLSTAFAALSLAIIAQGVMLAPPPPEMPPETE